MPRILLTDQQYIVIQENQSLPFIHGEQLYTSMLHSPPKTPQRIHVLRLIAFNEK